MSFQLESAKQTARKEVSDAQSLRWTAEAERDAALAQVAEMGKALNDTQEQLQLDIQKEVIRQLAAAPGLLQEVVAFSGLSQHFVLNILLCFGRLNKRKLNQRTT